MSSKTVQMQQKKKRQTSKLQKRGKMNSVPKPSKKSHRHAGLSPLSEAYARSLVNPYSAAGACVPDYPSIPSRKFKIFSKGVFESGTTGFGFIFFDPRAGVLNTTDYVFYSTAAYTGSTFQGGVAGTVSVASNSDYSAAGTGASALKGRIVSAGIRIRYAGTELNRGGIAVGYQHPTHSGLGGLTFTNVDTAPQSKRFRPKESWLSVCYCPVLVDELTFSTPPGPGAVASFMGWAVQAPSGGTSVSYEFEVHVNYEVNGVGVRGMTPSASDPSGLAVVHTAANLTGMRPTDQPSAKEEESFLKRVEDMGMQTISSWGHQATDYLSHSEVGDWLTTAWDTIEWAGSMF